MSRVLRLARILISALEDRIALLAKKYKVDPQLLTDLVSADPTQGSYLEWLIRQHNSRQFTWPEDRDRIHQALTLFHQLKRSPRRLQEVGLSPDINKIKFRDLEAKVSPLSGQALSLRQQVQEEKVAGSRWLLKGPYSVLEITTPEAACHYAKHTHWCTSNITVAARYLQKSPLYVVFENNQKVAQYHADSKQLKDIQDDPFEDPKLVVKIYRILHQANVPGVPFLGEEQISSYEDMVAYFGMKAGIYIDMSATWTYRVELTPQGPCLHTVEWSEGKAEGATAYFYPNQGILSYHQRPLGGVHGVAYAEDLNALPLPHWKERFKAIGLQFIKNYGLYGEFKDLGDQINDFNDLGRALLAYEKENPGQLFVTFNPVP
jgi:hypothetical protein